MKKAATLTPAIVPAATLWLLVVFPLCIEVQLTGGDTTAEDMETIVGVASPY